MTVPVRPTPAALDAGPSVADGEALVRWLDAHASGDGGRRLFRLPVALRFDGPGKLMIERAAVGVDADAGLEVDLDDTAMGVSLLERCRAICAKDSAGCVVWLDAHWGRNLPLPPLPGMPPPPAHALAVRDVAGLVAADAIASATHVSVAR